MSHFACNVRSFATIDQVRVADICRGKMHVPTRLASAVHGKGCGALKHIRLATNSQSVSVHTLNREKCREGRGIEIFIHGVEGCDCNSSTGSQPQYLWAITSLN